MSDEGKDENAHAKKPRGHDLNELLTVGTKIESGLKCQVSI